MVDATQAMESSYVDADLIRSSPTRKCVVIDAGEYKQHEYKNEKYFKLEIYVEIDGKKKKWCPNKDSVKNISDIFTADTENWVGKIIKLSVQKVAGKDAVVGSPIVA